MVASAPLEVGQLVRVRGQQWVVSDVSGSTMAEDELSTSRLSGQTLATLTSVSEDDLGEELSVVWEVEPGREVIPAGALPEVPSAERWDNPQTLGALLDAVRWGTVASADVNTLQAPFRAGIQIKDYQLQPVAMALGMPRVALLVADDVGLGKTIEAGLVIHEMILRHRVRRVLVVCPAPLTVKWAGEMWDKFGLRFTILDTAALAAMRRTHGLQSNPFTIFPRMIISLPWLRTPRVQRLLDEVLGAGERSTPFLDLLVVDEAHHCAPPAPAKGRRGYAVDSRQTEAVRQLSQHSQHRVLLSATPHNGYSESWQALLELLDPHRFARGVPPDQKTLDEVLVRRLKDEIEDADGRPEFAARLPAEPLPVAYRSKIGGSRLTLAVVTDLVAEAKQEILLVSYATYPPAAVSAALVAAVERGVSVTLLLERQQDNPGWKGLPEPFPDLRATQVCWPLAERSPGASLHAKVLVVDRRVALVGSANLTASALERNLECGLLVRGGDVPRLLAEHLTSAEALTPA